MADPPTNPDTAEDGRDPGSTTGTPRWVTVSVAIAIVVVVLVILMLSGVLGEHGPGRHSGGLDSPTPSSYVLARHHTPSGSAG